jgi:EAL domain-containing protein (putative c-di-GMP-specific phosphodiesterase class I)
MGSDEFGIILTDIHNKEDIVPKLQNIINSFQNPFIISDYELYMTLSMGISIYPDDGKKIKTLISNSDAALHYAKAEGENNYKFFNSNMTRPSLQHLQLANDLRQAIKKDEFVLYYHPQINVNNNSFKGMEALIRWQHPSLGLLSPAKFIPLAEETGLILKIDEWVLKTACAHTKALQESGLPNLQVSVNLSARHFQRKELPQLVKNVLNESKLEAKYLEVEITESAAIQNIESTIEILKELKKIGIQISIDDFGTGYCALGYLKKMQVDNLKIDKSFIDNLTTNPNNQAITNTIIGMAKNLKLKVIAEGVETNKQLDFLKKQNCNYVQGYLFTKPEPLSKVEKTLKKKITIH